MTVEVLYVKEGDTGIPIPATLKDRTGALVNLTGSSVDFVMRLSSWVGPVPPAPKVNADAVIVGDPLLAAVSYTSLAPDFDTVGTYDVEWEVTFAGGSKQRFPGEGYDKIAVGANLE